MDNPRFVHFLIIIIIINNNIDANQTKEKREKSIFKFNKWSLNKTKHTKPRNKTKRKRNFHQLRYKIIGYNLFFSFSKRKNTEKRENQSYLYESPFFQQKSQVKDFKHPIGKWIFHFCCCYCSFCFV